MDISSDVRWEKRCCKTVTVKGSNTLIFMEGCAAGYFCSQTHPHPADFD